MVLIPCITALPLLLEERPLGRVSKDELVKEGPFETAASPPPQGEDVVP
jgi:hypothetical protein